MKSIIYLGVPPSERAETEALLASANLSVIWADDVAVALAELQRREIPVLIDLARGVGALQAARELRTERPGVLIFAVADSRRPDLTSEAVLTGVADVFARPPAPRRLLTAIERELNYESGRFEGAGDIVNDALYGHSASMREVMALVCRSAAMRAGVLVCGERGTGRQLVARTIHAAQSDTAAFVAVDCAAYDGDELESELFGNVARPANGDGARGLERITHEGRLHEAIGGTLYLQNVAEAPARVQARLARVLRDREAVLAGTGVPIGLDIRPIAGVDPGVEKALGEERIREDLFNRLSAIRIDLPPLRNRRDDIPALANYFLRRICSARRVPPATLSRPALSLLTALPWRGNATELRMLLESVIAGLAAGRAIGLEEVLAHMHLDGGSTAFTNAGTLRQARARFEREYIVSVLEQHHGRISEAARALGIQRTNLYRKMRSLRVDRRKGKNVARPFKGREP